MISGRPPNWRVDHQRLQSDGLVLAQIVEGAAMHVEQIARRGAQHAVVGEVGGRHAGDRAVRRVNLDRQIGVGDVAGPIQPVLLEQARGLRRERHHRAAPAGDLLAGAAFEQVDALADQAVLLVRREIRRQIVLGVGMRGDVEAGLGDLLDRVRIDLGAARIDEERRRHAEPLQRPHQPPDADAAAVGGPGLGGVIDGALLQMRGLHRIVRRAVVGPGLEHHRDRDGDLLAVRPGQRFRLSWPTAFFAMRHALRC